MSCDYLRFALPEIVRWNWKTFKYLKELETASSGDCSDMHRVVARKKYSLLLYASSNVPYYMRNLVDLPSIEELANCEGSWEKIPFAEKTHIAENEKDYTSIIRYNVTWKDTSGSTGAKFRFLTDIYQNMWAEASTAFVKKQVTGKYVPKETVLWGAPRDRTSSEKLLTKIKNRLRQYNQIIAHDPSDEFLSLTIKTLLSQEPDLLLGYPNLLKLLIHADKQKCISKIPYIMTAGEWLRADIREELQNYFSGEVFDFYGCREMGSIAYECPSHNGLHILSPMVFAEAVRSDGTPCNDGELGEIVLTSLVRRSMPFIRYRVGDMGTIANDPCPCGCPFPRITSLAGRTMEVVTLKNGRSLVANFWTFLSREVEGIRQFRVIQDKTGHIVMEIVSEAEPELLRKRILEEITERLGEKAQIEIMFVDRLPVNQSGKTGLIVSNYVDKND